MEYFTYNIKGDVKKPWFQKTIAYFQFSINNPLTNYFKTHKLPIIGQIIWFLPISGIELASFCLQILLADCVVCCILFRTRKWFEAEDASASTLVLIADINRGFEKVAKNFG